MIDRTDDLDDLDDADMASMQIGEPDDAQFEELFAALDDVHASEGLQDATLALIARLSAESGNASTAEAGTSAKAGVDTSTETNADVEAGVDTSTETDVEKNNPTIISTATSAAPKLKSRRSARFRAIRVAAVAACLVLALSGGVAYATPTSHITVTRGDVSIELGVNCFGVSVSANADDEAGCAIVESEALVNVSVEDALTHTVDALDQRSDVDAPIDVRIDAPDGPQQERLENASTAIMAEHGIEAAPGESALDPPALDALEAAAPPQPADADAAASADGVPEQGTPPGQADAPSPIDDAAESPAELGDSVVPQADGSASTQETQVPT